MKSPVTIYVVAVIVAAACSKPADQAGSAAASPDSAPPTAAELKTACTIATDAEMSDALGAQITGKDETGANRCLFKTANPVVYADVEIDRENADAAWQGINAGDSSIGAQKDSLSGIGDKAFFGPRERLYLRKGNAFAAIEAGFDDKVRERARKVARLVASKL